MGTFRFTIRSLGNGCTRIVRCTASMVFEGVLVGVGHPMMKSLIRLAAVAAALVSSLCLSGPAYADEIVIKRNVTLRAAPSKSGEVIAFPPIGTPLKLLDDGVRRNGYYHVAYDGRTGWVYFSFVERRPDAAEPEQAFLPPPSGKMTAHYINVDQGASALLEFSCGAILIDAGGRTASDGDHLLAYLNAFFARRPDLNRRLAAVFITHTHVDHNLTLRRVAEQFRVGGYIHNGILVGSGRTNARWMSSYVTTATPAIPSLSVTEDMVEAAGPDGLTNTMIDPVACTDTDPQIHVLSGSYAVNPGWPASAFAKNGNYQSLVIRVDYGRSSFLFTGDMEDKALDTLVRRFQGTRALDVDVYTVGHHGSYNGTTQAFLDAMTPKLAVMSAGNPDIHLNWTAWDYGHPRKQAVDMLVGGVSTNRVLPKVVQVASAVNTFAPYLMSRAVYSTSWDGDISVDADKDATLTVRAGQ